MNSRLTERLRALRSRLRRLYLTAGLLRLSGEGMVFLIGAFLVDRWVSVPSGVRLVLLVVTGAFFLQRLRSLVLYPLRRHIRVEDMALAVEREHAELDGILASAVELSRVADNPPPDVSPALLERWFAEVERRVEQVRFDRIFRYRRLKQLAAVCAVLLAGIALHVVLRPADSGVFLRRLAGSSVEWPRLTHLSLDVVGESQHYRVERDPDGAVRKVVIARGGSLPVEVEAGGLVPDDVFLRIEETGRAGRSEEVRMQVRDEEDDVFVYRFRNVLRPLRMYPRGGDDPGRRLAVEVEVVPPPSVEHLIATMTPPPYTGIAPIREERQEFSVPAGTRLDLEIQTVGRVREGTVTTDGDPSTAADLTIDPENPSRLLYSFVVEKSGTFNLHLVGESGFKNLVPLDYAVNATADRGPSIEVLRPSVSHLQVTERGVIPMHMRVGDDYGLTAVDVLLTRFGAADAQQIPLWARGAEPAASDGLGDEVFVHHGLDLLTHQVPRDGVPASMAQGETLVYEVRALDNREDATGAAVPNEFRTKPRTIELVSEGEKTRKLSDRSLRLKHEVQSLKSSQEDKAAALRSVMGADDAELSAQGGRELNALEVDQNRIAHRSQQITKDLSEILDEYLLNRLDQSPTAERALIFRLGQLDQDPETLRFDPAPLRALVAAYDGGQFGDLDVTGNLMEMLRLGLVASEDHAVKAAESLREARVTTDDELRRTGLSRAADHQDKVVETYAALLEKMEEWEDFQEILELWRALVQDQKDLNQRYKTSGGGK